jgi:hypothetical protein
LPYRKGGAQPEKANCTPKRVLNYRILTYPFTRVNRAVLVSDTAEAEAAIE